MYMFHLEDSQDSKYYSLFVDFDGLVAADSLLVDLPLLGEVGDDPPLLGEVGPEEPLLKFV